MKLFKYALALLSTLLLSTSLYAKTAGEINFEADKALKEFNKEVKGSVSFVDNRVKGLLIFPSVVKAGIGVGGEYGEGVLRVGGKSVQYYSTASASIGFQLGAQKKSLIIAFMTEDALNNFRNKSGWKIGVDGSVALINLGAGKDINSETVGKPVVGFMFGNKGLMYNLTLEGSKFTKIVR
ncbi:MAG: YSC84-related protein [Campylobacterota bacterium]|nr:YSC84-related protein [Campylobacterota bacterium]